MTNANQRPGAVDLSGRTAIVTGAGSGIGRAMATTFARAGAEVMVSDLLADRAEETVALIEAEGGKAIPSVGSVADELHVKDFIGTAITRWGKIDIVCNNAGIMDKMQFTQDVTTELWNRVMAVNATGPFFVTREVLPHMRARKYGVIVNTASIAGLRGGNAGAAYVASKHAVVGLTRAIAWAHGNEGIRCNAICPGDTSTNITNGLGIDAFDPVGFARALPVIALCERSTQPQSMANVALFLVSDGAEYMNGAIIPVDGGWMAA